VRVVRKASVEERRNEILETTCLVVIERGFAATRILDVAQRLGVSTGLIHYHFDSKDQLLAEAFEYAAVTDLARLDAELAKPGTAVERLDRIFRLYTPAEHDTGWLLWIDGWGEAIRSPALRRISQDLDLRWQERVEEVIRLGVKEGELTCPDPHASAWRLVALIDGLGVQMAVHDDVVSEPELLAWVRSAACSELGLPPGTFDRTRRRRAS
jgi:AcrR family transcriptional regulator